MPNINREFISQKNINGTGNPCKYIVIHETDNYSRGAGARTHAKAQHDGNFADMSVHYYCGSDGIYQAAEHTCKCWHIGREYGGNHSIHDATNNNSIGIEICVNEDGNYTAARQNAIELVKYLLQTTGIPASRVIRHFDAKGKYCPRKMMDNPALWEDFKAQIQGSSSGSSGSSGNSGGGSGTYGTGMYKVNVDDLAIRTGPSTKYAACGSITDKGTYTIAEIQNTCWGRLKSGAGWICIDADYCSPAGPSGSSSGWNATGTATCTGSGVRVRQSPGGTILGQLGVGNRFEVDGQKSGDWVHIKVAGIGIGWMHKDYVKYD